MVLAIVELQEMSHHLASTVRSFVVILRLLSLFAPRLVVLRLVAPRLVALRPVAQLLAALRLVVPCLVALLLVAPRLVVPRLVALLLVAPVHPHKDHLPYNKKLVIFSSLLPLSEI